MKRLMVIICTLLFVIVGAFTVVENAFATDGTCVSTHAFTRSSGPNGNEVRSLIFTVVGDVTAGTITDQTISASDFAFVRGWYAYRVIITSLAGDTNVDDNGDIAITHTYVTDLMAAQGLNMLDDSTVNYIRLTQTDPIVSPLILTVDQQTNASGKFTVTLIVVK